MQERMLRVRRGVLSEDDLSEYVEVVQRALDIHVEKDAIRRGLWKDYPAKDQFFQIKVKADRASRILERGSLDPSEAANVLEETYDIINYSTFAARTMP